jgi:NTE family protein
VTFFDTRELEPWKRSQRSSRRTTLTHEHLLASSAIPFVFPPHRCRTMPRRNTGDGSMRHTAPLSPVIHLGPSACWWWVQAACGNSRPWRRSPANYPSLAQMAGHALSSIFLDTLPLDVERALRINQTLSLIPEAERARSNLRPLELLVINPSDRLDRLAAAHLPALPQGMRNLLRVLGVDSQHPEAQSTALASYLMFTPTSTH